MSERTTDDAGTGPPPDQGPAGPESGGGGPPPDLLEHEFRQNRRDLLRFWLPWAGLALVLCVVGWFFVEPAPPRRVVLAAGPKDGAYYGFAQQYAEVFRRNGIELAVLETAGTVQNYQLLASGEADAAIVQGGAAPEGYPLTPVAVASLYLEPVWVFHRGDAGGGNEASDDPGLQPGDLRGKRVAVGPPGSGTRAVAVELLAANGVAEGDPGGTTFLPLGGRAAADALTGGRADAAFFVLAPGSPLVAELLRAPGVRLMDFRRAAAYARRYPYLSTVLLPAGVMDLGRDLPPRDVHLVAPAANLVAREDLHHALIPLLAEAATRAHERGDLLTGPGRFPNMDHVEWPLSEAARRYFRSGPPFLQRYLPFWAAALADRLKFLLLPLLTLLIPLLRVAPPLYRWRIRAGIYRWYYVLRKVDQKLRGAPASERFERELVLLDHLERELAEVRVPLSYMEEFYNLRLHSAFVHNRVLDHVRRHHGGDGRPAPAAPSAVEAGPVPLPS